MTSAVKPYIRKLKPHQTFMGDPDGPLRYIESLGEEVPTFIDPRKDLVAKSNGASANKPVDYHIPIAKRGKYLPTQLSNYDPGIEYPLSKDGFVRCDALAATRQICQRLALNRTGRCTVHGGALHPADKLVSAHMDKSRLTPDVVNRLSRIQKVAMGIIPVSELSDEEIAKGSVREDNGQWATSNFKLDTTIANAMKDEFFKRAAQFYRDNAFSMLEVMRDIALDDTNEARDRVVAAQFNIERVFGKTPDVLITAKTDKPFEEVFTSLVGGSREEFRQGQTAIGAGIIDGEVEADEEDIEYAETVELDDAVDSGLSGSNENESESSADQSSDSETESGDSEVEEVDSESNAMIDRVQSIQDKQARIKAAKDRLKKAKNKRMAAKALGLPSVNSLGFGLNFVEKTLKDGSVETRMRLIPPDHAKRADFG